MDICCSKCGANDVQKIEQVIKLGSTNTTGTQRIEGRHTDGTFWGGRSTATAEISTISRSLIAEELHKEFEAKLKKPAGPGGGVVLFGLISGIVIWFLVHSLAAWWLATIVSISSIVGIVYFGNKKYNIKEKEDIFERNFAEYGHQRVQMLVNGYYCLKCRNKFLLDLSGDDIKFNPGVVRKIDAVIKNFSEQLKNEFKNSVQIGHDISRTVLLNQMIDYRIAEPADNAKIFFYNPYPYQLIIFTSSKLISFDSRLIESDRPSYSDVHEIQYANIDSVSCRPSEKKKGIGELVVNGEAVIYMPDSGLDIMVEFIKNIAAAYKSDRGF